jgi:hypothetical protein
MRLFVISGGHDCRKKEGKERQIVKNELQV